MPSKELFHDLREVFSKHGHPSYEEPGWAVVVSLQVLILQNQEKIMASIDDLVQKAASEASALVDLNSSVAAFVAAGGTTGTGVAPGQTFISTADQAKLDAAAANIDANIAKVGEIKNLLSSPAAAPTPTPSPTQSAGPVSATPPVDPLAVPATPTPAASPAPVVGS